MYPHNAEWGIEIPALSGDLRYAFLFRMRVGEIDGERGEYVRVRDRDVPISSANFFRMGPKVASRVYGTGVLIMDIYSYIWPLIVS